MTVYTYDFNGTDTDWGTVPVPSGHPALVAFGAAQWRRQGNKPVTNASVNGTAILVAQAGLGDVDLAADVSPGGGDSLYFRVQDASNFLRARVEYSDQQIGVTQTTTVYLYADGDTDEQYWDHQPRKAGDYTVLPSQQRTNYIQVVDYVRGIAIEEVTNGSVTNRWATEWVEKTERFQTYFPSEVITSGREGTGPIPTRLRVRAQGTSINLYVNGSSAHWLQANTQKYLSVNRHGIGRSPATFGDGYGLDNLSVDDLATPPNAPTLWSPWNSQSFDRLTVQRFSWIVSDPDAGDTQSRFDLRYRLVGASSWTTVSGDTPSPFWDAPVSTFAAGNYEWQVRTYDQRGQVSPWSGSNFFTAATQSSPVSITAPANDGTVSNVFNVTWSAPAQDAYQIQVIWDAIQVPYWTSQPIVSASTRSHQITLDSTTNGEYLHVQVRIKDDGLWTEWTSVKVLASFSAPDAPDVQVYDGHVGPTAITFTYMNPIPDPGKEVAYNEVWVNDGDGERRVATNLPYTAGSPATWTYYTPVSGRDYFDQVRFVAVGENGATASGTPWDPHPTPT